MLVMDQCLSHPFNWSLSLDVNQLSRYLFLSVLWESQAHDIKCLFHELLMAKLANQWPVLRFSLPIYFPHSLQNSLFKAQIWAVLAQSGWSQFLGHRMLFCDPILLWCYFYLCIPYLSFVYQKTSVIPDPVQMSPHQRYYIIHAL